MSSSRPSPHVALFVTCLVDLMRPSVGFAAARLLEEAGCRVSVPLQTCCGQPSWNGGDRRGAQALAAQVIEAFAPFDYVVAPSGSCAGMIRTHYPELFKDDPDLATQAQALSDKTYELTSFLVDVMKLERVQASHAGVVTYHDSCSGLRELGVQSQPRTLLKTVEGLTLKEMTDSDVCCGFGGTFAVTYGALSDAIVSEKMTRIEESVAAMVLAGDLGCLMNMAGKMTRNGKPIAARHVAEVLAGLTDEPPIGWASQS